MSAESQPHDVFHAIADPTRRKMLKLLADQDMPIAAITEQFPISRTAVVKHLDVLSEAGLVTGRRSGREKLYRLQPEPLREVQQWLAYYERFWHNRLSVLKYIAEHDGEPSPD